MSQNQSLVELCVRVDPGSLVNLWMVGVVAGAAMFIMTLQLTAFRRAEARLDGCAATRMAADAGGRNSGRREVGANSDCDAPYQKELNLLREEQGDWYVSLVIKKALVEVLEGQVCAPADSSDEDDGATTNHEDADTDEDGDEDDTDEDGDEDDTDGDDTDGDDTDGDDTDGDDTDGDDTDGDDTDGDDTDDDGDDDDSDADGDAADEDEATDVKDEPAENDKKGGDGDSDAVVVAEGEIETKHRAF